MLNDVSCVLLKTNSLLCFDENLKNVFNIKNNKLLVVERVITQGLFTVEYTPLVNVFNKKVNEYYAYVILPHAINMELEEFVKLAKQKSFRFAFYNKFFEQ